MYTPLTQTALGLHHFIKDWSYQKLKANLHHEKELGKGLQLLQGKSKLEYLVRNTTNVLLSL